MDYVALVMFAIQAAIRLGQKLQTVFEDETRDNPLILPPVEGTQLPTFDEVETFFESDEGKGFVALSTDTDAAGRPIPLGMYADLWQRRNDVTTGGEAREQLIQAFVRVQALKNDPTHDTRGGFGGDQPAFLAGTNALFVVKQWREGSDPKRHPVQRIAGTVVSIALDYAKIDPRLFGGNGRGDRLAQAFLSSLDKVDFAETKFDDLLIDVLDASLRTVSENSGLIVRQADWSQLLKQVSVTLANDFEKASGNDDKLAALYGFRRELLQDVLKTAASVVGEHPDHFLGAPSGSADALLQGVLKGVLGSLQDEPNLFTGRAAADIFAAAMRAVSANARLVLPDGATGVTDDFLRQLLTGVAQQLATSAAATPPGIFTPDLLTDVATVALEVTSANAARLIVPTDLRKQLLCDALKQVTAGFALALQHDGSLAQALHATFSRDHLLEIARQAFTAVAANPSGLLGLNVSDPQKGALAQLVGAVAQGIAQDPSHLLNGDDYTRLIGIALEAVARNPDRLLHLDTSDPQQQVLAQVISGVLSAASKNLAEGGRNLLTGENLLAILDAAITTVSSNVDGFLKEPDIVSMVVDRLLHASSSVLKNDLDANTLLKTFGPVLTQALKGRSALDVSDADLILPILKATA